MMRRSTDKRSGVPFITTTVRIYGAPQIATFEAMAQNTGRKPHELAADIVVGEMWEAGGTPGMRKLGREQRKWRREQVSSGG